MQVEEIADAIDESTQALNALISHLELIPGTISADHVAVLLERIRKDIAATAKAARQIDMTAA